MGKRVLVTGGAGFVGSSLALALKRAGVASDVIVVDNLRRRGSELAIPRLRDHEIEFIHGDIRCPEDLDAVGAVDLVLECSAEPCVRAGYDGDPRYLIQTNLLGTVNCLEHARRHQAGFIFLSTSRVYPIAGLRDLPLERAGDRLALPEGTSGPGWSSRGITVDFPLSGSRSLYGATKLCSEHLVEEYVSMYQMPAVVNRCGVISGPWQMGRVDQGFFVLWAARHHYRGKLDYRGFDGHGLQVRDVLHVDDLCDFICLQINDLRKHQGRVYSIGGGQERSVSLRELTALCGEMSGRKLEPGRVAETHPSDVPYYVTDNSDATAATGWKPTRSIEQTLAEVFRWLEEESDVLENHLA
jgi:CDP-paratose 2-epimerase